MGYHELARYLILAHVFSLISFTSLCLIEWRNPDQPCFAGKICCCHRLDPAQHFLLQCITRKLLPSLQQNLLMCAARDMANRNGYSAIEEMFEVKIRCLMKYTEVCYPAKHTYISSPRSTIFWDEARCTLHRMTSWSVVNVYFFADNTRFPCKEFFWHQNRMDYHGFVEKWGTSLDR